MPCLSTLLTVGAEVMFLHSVNPTLIVLISDYED